MLYVLNSDQRPFTQLRKQPEAGLLLEHASEYT